MKKILGSAGLASLLMAGVASAQTTTATTTPGIPNTGAGDIVLNAFVLGVAALVAIGGALYLYMNRVSVQ
jgi:hypothetical protein